MAVDGADDDEAVNAASHAAMQAYAHAHSSPDRSKAIKIGKVGLTRLCCVSPHMSFIITIIDASSQGCKACLDTYRQSQMPQKQFCLGHSCSDHTYVMPLSRAVKPASTVGCGITR